MEDVWVVISLLAFGSLLFCLCCYKVTNLLYMLYHIDDQTDSLTGNEITANTATALTAAAGALTSLGALPIALAVDSGGGGGGGRSPNGPNRKPMTATPPAPRPLPPPAYTHMNHHSTPTLYPLEKVGKTHSVTSLSVGVQYDPRDVVASRGHHHVGRYTAVEYIPADGLRGSTHRKTHLHVSAPDFRGSYEMTRHSNQRRHHDMLTASSSLHHHHHHHHLHRKSSAQGGTRPLAAAAAAATASPRNFLESSSMTPISRGRPGPPPPPDYAYFGSLGRTHYRGGMLPCTPVHASSSLKHGSLSESDPEVWPPLTHSPTPTASGGLHPPPLKSARLSSTSAGGNGGSVKRLSSARRYGSIRVAECSFIEAESQPSTPTASASLCELKASTSMVPSYNRQPQYSMQQQQQGYCSLQSPSDPSLPPPPSPPPQPPEPSPSLHRLCNGPLNLRLRSSYGGGGGGGGVVVRRMGSNGQHSHIIPPPQNFSNTGQYTTLRSSMMPPLTTTRIGSSLNLSSHRQHSLWPHHDKYHPSRTVALRSDSPPF